MSGKSVTVGFLGPSCTFGYQAASKLLSDSRICRYRPKPISFPNHSAICDAVGRGKVKYGVVAIENVLDGVVTETVHAVESVASHRGIAICGEVTVPIELFCMSKTGEFPKRLLSHHTALRQCHSFVTELQGRGVIIEVRASTGQAAEEASKGPCVAALAPSVALRSLGLNLVVPESVVDHKNSATRFWVLSKEYARRTGKDKTCFLINLEQSMSGALYKSLGIFADNGINVLLLYPIPVLGRCWEYTFLVEASGHVDDVEMDRAWDDFRKLWISLQPMRFLGSYPNSTSV